MGPSAAVSRRRIVVITLGIAGAVLLSIVFYVALGGLAQHKGRIEAFVTKEIGRPFAIDGAFQLELLPAVSLVAERVRIGNAAWGSQPQMVEIGRFATKISLWSLISGPVVIRSLELSDVTVLLETDAKGKGNWVFRDALAPNQATETPRTDAIQVPALIQHSKLVNVRVIYRAPGTADRVVLIETLTIEPRSADRLAIAVKGGLDEYATTLTGEVGPVDALISGRDIRVALQGALGDLRLEASGGVGRLGPPYGADLKLKIQNSDVGALLKNFRLPAFANGPLNVDARLSNAGELARVDIDAKLGEINAKVSGTLRTLGLPGSDLRVEVAVADAARLAAAFDVTGLPAAPFEAGGRFVSSSTEIKLDGISAKYAGATAKVDGTIHTTGDLDPALRFDVAAESLARLREGLPDTSLSIKGHYAGSRAKDELKDITGRIGETEFAAQASMARIGKRRVEAELTSPKIDLTKILAKKKNAATPKPQAPPKGSKKYVFDEKPLPLRELKGTDAKLHLAFAEVVFAAGTLRDVDATFVIDGGRASLKGRAKGGYGGTVDGSMVLTPAGEDAADLAVKLAIANLRTGFMASGEVNPNEVPPTSVQMDLRTRGASARKMASSANGRVLVTLGPGKLKEDAIDILGGDLLSGLVGKLDPFAAQDPYTQLECMVTGIDVVDGKATVSPVLLQSTKVAVVASGEVDLHTEELTLDFHTRPREGIGISAGMFTNPFIRLVGTLANPSVGVGAEGAAKGAAAVATGGLTVLAEGLVDRARGQQDLCKEALKEAMSAAK